MQYTTSNRQRSIYKWNVDLHKKKNSKSLSKIGSLETPANGTNISMLYWAVKEPKLPGLTYVFRYRQSRMNNRTQHRKRKPDSEKKGTSNHSAIPTRFRFFYPKFPQFTCFPTLLIGLLPEVPNAEEVPYTWYVVFSLLRFWKMTNKQTSIGEVRIGTSLVSVSWWELSRVILLFTFNFCFPFRTSTCHLLLVKFFSSHYDICK